MRITAALATAWAAAAASCAPQMFWVNYMNSADEMSVSWTTACSADSTVYWGTNANGMTSRAAGNQTTYTFDGTYTSPYIHHVVLAGLPLSTTIYYKVGGTQSGYSATMNFTTSPGEGLQATPRTFAIVGDLGQTSNSQDTLNHLMAAPLSKFTAFLFPGDLSYADSDEPRWDSFQTMIAPVAQQLPIMSLPGNHEMEYLTAGGQSPIAYQTRFSMPYVYPGTANQAKELYYSFNVAGVHFIMLCTYCDFTAGTPQYTWLEQDLAAVDRENTPWVVAQMHAPWYNSNNAHPTDGEAMRQAIESLLYNGGVDAIFTGHVHAYERCYRTYNFQRNVKAPHYITIGDGGNREGLAASWKSPQPAWSAFRQASYGHGELQVVNATHMHWTWHQNPDLEPTVADELWIVKGQDSEEAPVTAEPRFARRA